MKASDFSLMWFPWTAFYQNRAGYQGHLAGQAHPRPDRDWIKVTASKDALGPQVASERSVLTGPLVRLNRPTRASAADRGVRPTLAAE